MQLFLKPLSNFSTSAALNSADIRFAKLRLGHVHDAPARASVRFEPVPQRIAQRKLALIADSAAGLLADIAWNPDLVIANVFPLEHGFIGVRTDVTGDSEKSRSRSVGDKTS